jgi:hypothetical protein
MAFEQRNLMGVAIEREGSLPDGAAASLPDGRKEGLAANTRGETGGIPPDQGGRELEVAKRGSQEDVRRCAPIQKVAGSLRRFSDKPLGRRGIVILIPGIKGSAKFEE